MVDDLHIPTALSRVSYPPPPWLLYGSALFASFRVQAERVAALIPPPLSLIRIGSLAAGYLFVARYGPGSTLEYSELIAGTTVRYGRRFGLFVTHIGVDSQVSQRGGQELWYMPKHLWQFEWGNAPPETQVRVWDGTRLVCTLSGAPLKATFWTLHTSLTFLNLRGSDVAIITSEFDVGVAPIPWEFQLGPDGPLTPLTPIGRLVTFALKGGIEVQALHVLE